MGQINPGLIVAGRYRLLRKLGQGGMGTVWSARNELIDREVAIKMMRPEAAANPVSLQRFFTEAKASGRLRHPNITEIFDLGQAEDGSPFLVLELLTGEPLDSVLRRVPALAPVQTLLLGRSIAAGLNVAHAKGIVHRDLKPANIYLHRDPVTLEIIPKVLDFGISKVTGPEAIDHHATHTGTVVGSPTYMSPEQARGVSDIDARADLWSVGVLLYKCITGRAPFNAANYNALMVSIMTEPHQPVTKFVPSCPQVVSDIIDDCLRKDRADRVQSAKALMSRIDSALLAMNAERAKLELPSDDMDDDMPTIARGNRQELVQLVTATATAAATPQHMLPQSQQQQQQQYNMAPSMQQAQMQMHAQQPQGYPSMTPAPLSPHPNGFALGHESPTSAPHVVSQPGLPAVTPQQISGTQPAALRTELDPVALAKKRDRQRVIGVFVAAACFFSVVVFVAVLLTRRGGTTDSTSASPGKDESAKDQSGDDDNAKPAKSKDDGKSAKSAKAKDNDDVEALEPLDTASTKGTAVPATATATATATTAAPTATTPPPAPTPTPTYTATAKPTATVVSPPTTSTAPKPLPTSTSTATTTTVKPPKKTSTAVSGPGF